MIVLGVVIVLAFTNQRHEKVSIDPFVVMQRNEREIVESHEGTDDQNPQSRQLPGTLRNLRAAGWRVYIRLLRSDVWRARQLLTARFCRGGTHRCSQLPGND